MKALAVYFSIAALVILGCFAKNNDQVKTNSKSQETSNKTAIAILGEDAFGALKPSSKK